MTIAVVESYLEASKLPKHQLKDPTKPRECKRCAAYKDLLGTCWIIILFACDALEWEPLTRMHVLWQL